MEEKWKTISQDERYEVSNFGRVRNKKADAFLLAIQQNPIDTHKYFLQVMNGVDYNLPYHNLFGTNLM